MCHFDTIIIGGGHAGIEAAYASARLGCATALITLRKDRIGLMPCNPAVGGIGKGHIVFEISALGGLMPELCTRSHVQAKMLNTRKGPAVQGLRLQIDKERYAQEAQKALDTTDNLTVIEAMVDEVTHDAYGNASGVITADGTRFGARAVVLTTGTFLNGRIRLGEQSWPAGRKDEDAVVKLAEYMHSLDLAMERLRTGTPPRLRASSVDTSAMEQDMPHELNYLFEFEARPAVNSLPCYVTRTNPETHDIVTRNAERSPVLQRNVEGKAPRYCPSIEDKVTRFAHKTSHHIFLEPQGHTSEELYPNGISTCLPPDIQTSFIRSIRGFEHAEITTYGYAIEYDYVLPDQLTHGLELKRVPGFFLAGQINGTTGYEEAAGQGIIAGINAARKVQEKPAYVMERTHGYIGIMIDDLVTFGVSEPYRMFTSRAERRLILRQDNAFARLGPTAYELGLISHERYDAIMRESDRVHKAQNTLHHDGSEASFTRTISDGRAHEVRQELCSRFPDLSPREQTQLYAELLYKPYKERELQEMRKHEKYQHITIPDTFTYVNMPGLSKELQEKLEEHRPHTIAQASLVQGMTPAALSLLIFKVRQHTGDVAAATAKAL